MKEIRSIGIIGLGYVGLPLWLEYASHSVRTIGFDIDQDKTESLNNGHSYIKHIGDEAVQNVRQSGLAIATSDFSEVSNVQAIIICVPTPLDIHLEPNLSYVRNTVQAIMPFLQKGQLISLESTTYPGTTEEELVIPLEQNGFMVGKDIYVAYSPEREDPGNKKFTGGNIPKVVGAITPACLEKALELYGHVFQELVPVSTTKVAEFSKLLENIYRAVNIGLVNEMKIVADAMDVNIWEVIDAAATKPFGFTPFYPGPGLGGHCIPVDPFYLTWKAREVGVHTRFIELAGRVNRVMPSYVIEKVTLALNDKEKPVKGSKILIIGLSYKPNVDDTRESPTFALMNLLKERGAIISYYDPHILEIGPTREHMQWKGLKSVEWSEDVVSSQDCVLISTMHDAVDKNELLKWSSLIVDTRNTFRDIASQDVVLA